MLESSHATIVGVVAILVWRSLAHEVLDSYVIFWLYSRWWLQVHHELMINLLFILLLKLVLRILLFILKGFDSLDREALWYHRFGALTKRSVRAPNKLFQKWETLWWPLLLLLCLRAKFWRRLLFGLIRFITFLLPRHVLNHLWNKFHVARLRGGIFEKIIIYFCNVNFPHLFRIRKFL